MYGLYCHFWLQPSLSLCLALTVALAIAFELEEGEAIGGDGAEDVDLVAGWAGLTQEWVSSSSSSSSTTRNDSLVVW